MLDGTSAILMDFTVDVTNLSFSIGNDDPNFGPPVGEDLVAVLQGYRDGLLVSTVDLLTNRNDRMDQSIFLGDSVIDQALYYFADTNLNPTSLGEVIDLVSFDVVASEGVEPIPVPASLPLLLAALGGVSLLGWRGQRAV